MDTRLLVLGVLHRGDFHPYEIKRRLKAAMVECYVAVDVGTLYYAVRKLEKDGLIEALAQERVSRGGMRTIYRLTSKGRASFREDLHRQFDVQGPVAQTLYGALLFMHLADAEVVKPALRRRIEQLDALIAKLEPIRQMFGSNTSTGTRHLIEHIDRQRHLDREWLADLLEDLESNGIEDMRDPTRLAKD